MMCIFFIAIDIRQTGAFLKNEPISSGRTDKSLFYSLKLTELDRSVCGHVLSPPLVVINESNSTSEKRAIDNSKTNVKVAIEIRHQLFLV